MNSMDLFEAFNTEGSLRLPHKTAAFGDIPWSRHQTFEGVELKHIVTAKDTGGQFSFHLVRIAPGRAIGSHIHQSQLETHEVIAGTGVCVNDGSELAYEPGVVSIFPMGSPHAVTAGPGGLYLFAKFIPALV